MSPIGDISGRMPVKPPPETSHRGNIQPQFFFSISMSSRRKSASRHAPAKRHAAWDSIPSPSNTDAGQ